MTIQFEDGNNVLVQPFEQQRRLKGIIVRRKYEFLMQKFEKKSKKLPLDRTILGTELHYLVSQCLGGLFCVAFKVSENCLFVEFVAIT